MRYFQMQSESKNAQCNDDESCRAVLVWRLSPYTQLTVNCQLSIVNCQFSEAIQVVIAAGSHLFPFRTEKLSPPAPMVLQCNAGE